MGPLLRIADTFDRMAQFVGKAAGWVILPLIAVIMFDVVTRKIDFLRIGMSELSWYWLIEPIKLQDLEWHLHGIILLMTFGYGYLLNSHVRVDIFREMLPRRGQAKIEFWGLVVMAMPYLALVLYFAVIFVSLSIGQNEGSESLTGITHRYIIKSFTVIGFFFTLMAVVATFIRLCAYLYGSPEARDYAYEKLHIFPEDAADEAVEIKEDPSILGEGH